MARYFFDVHGNGVAEWDDEGTECADRSAIKGHVSKLLAEHDVSSGGNAFGQRLLSVTVHLSNGSNILTATSKPGIPLHLNWASEA